VLAACAPLNALVRSAGTTYARSACPVRPPDRTTLSLAPSLSLAWRREGVLIPAAWGESHLVALRDRVFFLGSLGSPRLSLMPLSAKDGSTISAESLQVWPGSPTILTASDALLYLGTDFGHIVALEPETGQTIWRKTPNPFHRVRRLYLAEGDLLAVVDPSSLYVLDPQSGDYLESDLPHWIVAWSPSTSTAFTSLPRAIDTGSGAVIWETYIPGAVAGPALLTEQHLIFRAGEQEGSVYVLDRGTGSILFTSSAPAVGNIARMGSTVFWLSLDGMLLSWSPGETDERMLASFGTDLFDTQCAQGGFYLAADPLNSIVFVYLGDTAQLLAFQLTP